MKQSEQRCHTRVFATLILALLCACSACMGSDPEPDGWDAGGFDGSAAGAGGLWGTGGSGGWPSFGGSGGMDGGSIDGGGIGADSGGSGASGAAGASGGGGADGGGIAAGDGGSGGSGASGPGGTGGGGGTDEDDSGVDGGTGGSGGALSLDDGLLAHYPFSGNADDASGNGNDGTVNGAALTEDKSGAADEAYMFDGQDDYILTDNESVVGDFSSEFTISLWFRTSSNGVLISNSPTGDLSDGQGDKRIYIGDDGSITCGVWSSTARTINTGTAYNDDKWHHVVLSKAVSWIRLYVDKEFIASATHSGIDIARWWGIGYANVGTNWPNTPSNHFFAGSIDDVRIYNRALTESEVDELHDLTDTGCVAGHYQRCGTDGDVHSFDSCGDDEGVAVDCPEQHATCVDLADNTAECRCLGHWEGDDCNTCPPPWDAFEGCWGFFDDFESGLGNWLVSGRDWALDDGTARSGAYCLSDSPGSVPLANSDASAITLDSIDLSASVDPVLRFWGKALLWDSGDHIRVYASADGGLNWDVLWDNAYQNIANWCPVQLDLAAYAGSQIKIRFRLTTDSDTSVGEGWWIDDVWLGERDTGLLPYPFFDDFESGLDNWVLSGRDWALTETDSRSTTHSLTDSPSGNYVIEGYPWATLAHPVDLSAATAPVLTFWYKATLGDSGDELRVLASQDAGTNWTEVWTRSGGTVSTWNFVQVDLSSHAGSPLALAFNLFADGDENLGDGWYIDDVQVGEL